MKKISMKYSEYLEDCERSRRTGYYQGITELKTAIVDLLNGESMESIESELEETLVLQALKFINEKIEINPKRRTK